MRSRIRTGLVPATCLATLCAFVIAASAARSATGGDEAASDPARDDGATRARRGDFDVRARVPCAQERGEALGECDAAASFGTGGDAVVVVSFPNGFSRTLLFERGDFVRANATMSGSGTDTDWRIDDGSHVIRVDDQRYVLPESLVRGSDASGNR